MPTPLFFRVPGLNGFFRFAVAVLGVVAPAATRRRGFIRFTGEPHWIFGQAEVEAQPVFAGTMDEPMRRSRLHVSPANA
jgi:hypothetical protein